MDHIINTPVTRHEAAQKLTVCCIDNGIRLNPCYIPAPQGNPLPITDSLTRPDITNHRYLPNTDNPFLFKLLRQQLILLLNELLCRFAWPAYIHQTAQKPAFSFIVHRLHNCLVAFSFLHQKMNQTFYPFFSRYHLLLLNNHP